MRLSTDHDIKFLCRVSHKNSTSQHKMRLQVLNKVINGLQCSSDGRQMDIQLDKVTHIESDIVLNNRISQLEP